MADEAAVVCHINETVKKIGKVDGFFNNIEIEGKQSLTENYGIDEFQKVIDINLNGVVIAIDGGQSNKY